MSVRYKLSRPPLKIIKPTVMKIWGFFRRTYVNDMYSLTYYDVLDDRGYISELSTLLMDLQDAVVMGNIYYVYWRLRDILKVVDLINDFVLDYRDEITEALYGVLGMPLAISRLRTINKYTNKITLTALIGGKVADELNTFFSSYPFDSNYKFR